MTAAENIVRKWDHCELGTRVSESSFDLSHRGTEESLGEQIRVFGSLLVSRSSGCILSGKRKVSWPQFDRNRPRLAVTTHWCAKLLPIDFGCRTILLLSDFLLLFFFTFKQQIFFFFFTHKHVLQWITMKRYSQLSPSCILPWMHNFGVLVKPKWNFMNIKWARMALYETWARCGWQRPLHNKSSHKTSVSLKQKGVCGLNTDWALLTNDRQDKHELLNKMTE